MPTPETRPRTAVSAARETAGERISWTVVAEIAARAAAPGERRLACFRPARGGQLDAATGSRAQQWLDGVASDDRAATEALFCRRGLDRGSRIEACREVELVDRINAPDWIDDLARFLELLDDADADGDTEVPQLTIADVVQPGVQQALASPRDRPWRFQRAFGPLLRGAVRWQAEAMSVLPLEVAAEAWRGMIAELARSWNFVACQTLNNATAEEQAASEREGSTGLTVHDRMFATGRHPRAAWLELFRRYPVLARLLARVYRRWQVTTLELMSRLARDRDRLENAFGRARPLGALVRYDGNAGDVHDGGRSVTILTFSSGSVVVYKPRPQEIAIAYLRLVRELNAVGLVPRLHERRIIGGDGYGWDEFVSRRPCATDAERRILHRRVGMLARLLQLLDATDVTVDNVVAHGGQPVPIDMETLLCPRRPLDPRLPASDRAAAERSWDSPFTSGVITARQGAPPGRRSPDVGALASGAFGFRWAAGGRGQAVSSMQSGGSSPRTRTEAAAAAPARCLADVVDGYVAMATHVSRAASRLAAEDGPLAAMATAPVRFVLRDTAVYQRILEDSLTPERLRDGVVREIGLERLYRAGLAGRAPLDVIQAEVDALRDLDIPLFFGRPNSKTLDWPGGGGSPGFFAGRSIERLHHRLEVLERSVDPDAERQLIRSALFSMGGGPSGTRSRSQPKPARPGRASGAGFWLDQAVRMGDELLSYAVTPNGERPVWIGLNYHPWTEAWRYGPLQADLLTGGAGLGVALADLYRLSGERRFRDAAGHVIGPTLERLAGAADYPMGGPARLRHGAFVGWGAWYYAVRRAGYALGDGDMIEMARRSRQQCRPVRVDDAAVCDDIIDGVAGLLLVLGGEHAGEQDDAIPFLAGRLLREQGAAGGRNGRSAMYPTGSPVLAALPPAHYAVELALSRAAQRAELALCDVFPSRPRRAGSPAGTTTGSVLAELGIAAERPDLLPGALAAADGLLGIGSAMTPADPLGPAEVAITAYQIAGGSTYRAQAEGWAAELVDRKHRMRRWFPERLAADRHLLSAVVGTTAVLHLLLKLHSPDTVGSLRLVETRASSLMANASSTLASSTGYTVRIPRGYGDLVPSNVRIDT